MTSWSLGTLEEMETKHNMYILCFWFDINKTTNSQPLTLPFCVRQVLRYKVVVFEVICSCIELSPTFMNKPDIYFHVLLILETELIDINKPS